MMKSLLIANRGEIACRVIRTAQEMGIRTVAVYSDADAKALHVRRRTRRCTSARSPAAESYLRGDRIIDAAKATGAEAIHPGYGFLSRTRRSPERSSTRADLGRAIAGKHRGDGAEGRGQELMRKAGVPVTPGYDGDNQDRRISAKRQADAIGYPVMIKAVAGGGGKGMRRVDAREQFPAALASRQARGQASFGDDSVLLEKYLVSPRHIEVQVFGDSHGNVVHLFERDC